MEGAAPDPVMDILYQPAVNHNDSDMESSSSSSDSSSDSSFSSSSDSDAENMINDDAERADRAILFPMLEMILHGRRRPKVEEYLNIVHQKSNEQFRKDFRLQREIAYNLIDELHESGFIPVHNDGRAKASAELSFLLFLRFVGNEDPHRTICELFNVSESSVFRIIRRVVDWLVTLVPRYVVWPEGDRRRSVTDGFARLQGIRGCLGAVDGSHVRIIKPCVENSRAYFNRKRYYSINLTAIADSDKKFLMAYCGEPGSMHDIRVFRRSDFHRAIEENPAGFLPQGTFLIGDAAYQGLDPAWIVVPYRDNGLLTPNQRQFNTIISSMRVVIEQAFGLLKGRFRRLLHQISLFDLPFVVDLVISCCILHNICLSTGDGGEDLMENVDNGGINDENREGDDEVALNDDLGIRASLFRQLFPHQNAN